MKDMLINVLSHHCGKNTNHKKIFIFIFLLFLSLERKYHTDKSGQLLGYSSV